MFDPSQANQYDKIVKENIEIFLPALIQKVLGIRMSSSEDLTDTVQYTIERKPDVLKRVQDEQQDEFILHLEFQSVDDPRMLKRMLLYRALLYEKYELSVRQYVVYMGDESPVMPTHLQQDGLRFSYGLVPLSRLPISVFLTSDQPQEIVMAILSNFGNTAVPDAVRQIIDKIRQTSASPLAFNRHIRQLRILANLRKLTPQIDLIMEGLMSFFKEEEDVLYVRGERKGKEEGKLEGKQEGKQEAVRDLLRKTDFTADRVAEILEVPLEQVLTIQAELKA